MEDIQDERTITENEHDEIKLLLFGNTEHFFKPAWINHGFSFKSLPPYGLIQKLPGPCGVIAAVQAQVLFELLYGASRIVLKDGLLRPSFLEKKLALTQAITNLLWRARGADDAVVARITTSKNNGADEQIVKVRSFWSKDELLNYISDNVKCFMNEKGISNFMYSLILTRGVDQIKHDMDFPENYLIGEDSYCSQEVINLILTGFAVSNVFDGEKALSETDNDSIILKGISRRSQIGFLSRSEHENNDAVGTFYKDPEYPIWVLHGHSHYLVLFGTSRTVLTTNRPFRLFYADSLSRSSEVCLEIHPNDGPPDEIDAIPTTMHCILTRWPNSRIKIIECNQEQEV